MVGRMGRGGVGRDWHNPLAQPPGTIPRFVLGRISLKYHILLTKHAKRYFYDLPTPYSMNTLFSEFFRTFAGVILGVRETIWG